MVLVARALLVALGVLVVSTEALAAPQDGPWGWPLAGPHEVARPFARPASAYGAGHRGVDLPSAEGAAVRASAAGRIAYAGLLAGRGVVVVTHGELRTTYEPVVAAVRVGQPVALGQVVGRLAPGHLGCPVAACLHWGLRRGEQYLDPVRLVERGPVRLLPLDPGAAAALRRAAPEPAVDRPAPAAPEPPAPAPPAEVEEPSWSLRAAEAPLGAAALVALVLGVALLARPRPHPDGPVSGGVAAPAGVLEQDEPTGPPALLLDLEQARARRAAS